MRIWFNSHLSFRGLPWSFIWLTWLAWMLAGCDQPATPSGPQYQNTPVQQQVTYVIAVHPLFNPVRLQQAYQPLVDYLNATIPDARFKLEASENYQQYEEKIRARHAAFLLPNPWQTLVAEKSGYRVIAQAGSSADFRGIFITRTDSNIREVGDIRGKNVSYPSHTALAACIMPQFYLHEHGINVLRDITNQYVGSQESSIMSAYLKKSDVAVTWPPPWRRFQIDHPQESKHLQVILETDSLVNNSFMVRDNVPQDIASQVQQALVQLSQSPDGKNILKASETDQFLKADNSTYEKVREFINRFEKNVRPVEKP